MNKHLAFLHRHPDRSGGIFGICFILTRKYILTVDRFRRNSMSLRCIGAGSLESLSRLFGRVGGGICLPGQNQGYNQ